MATSPAPGTCTTFPAIAGVPTRPSSYRNEVDKGWNAGGNSTKQLNGDVELAFTQPQVQGAVMGFTPTREMPEDYARITHGFLFGTDGVGRPTFRVVEYGRTITDPVVYTAGTVFAIRRISGRVTYTADGFFTFHSATPSDGVIMAGCTLYASGDTVESEETP